MRNVSKKEIDEITNIYAPMGAWFVAKVIQYLKKYGKDGNSLYSDLNKVEILIEEKGFKKDEEETVDTEEDF